MLNQKLHLLQQTPVKTAKKTRKNKPLRKK